MCSVGEKGVVSGKLHCCLNKHIPSHQIQICMKTREACKYERSRNSSSKLCHRFDKHEKLLLCLRAGIPVNARGCESALECLLHCCFYIGCEVGEVLKGLFECEPAQAFLS